MKINKLKFIIIAVCSLVSALCSESQCMESREAETKHTTYQEMKSLLDEHLRVNDSLLHSSKNQDIVVVLGATGSGKSTLINYLMGLDLVPNDNEEIELVDPNNPLAMKIGNVASQSQTLLPQYSSIGSLVFYDLPGFEDTRGTAVNILAGSFIKHIVENADSTRLVFTAGQDQMTAVRGKYVKDLIKVAKTLFPDNPGIIDSSLLIVTKSIKDTIETLIPYVQQKFPDILELSGWLNNRIVPMPKRNFGIGQRNIIINKINQINPYKINHVHIESIYSSDVKIHLKNILSSEMEYIKNKFLNQTSKVHQTIDSINQAKIYFSGCFENEVVQKINVSPLLTLLKPLSESIYEAERNEILRIIAQDKQLEIIKLDLEKASIENAKQDEIIRKQQEQMRLAEEYRKKEQAERVEKDRIADIERQIISEREQEIKKIRQDLDLARKMGVISSAHLRHYWHKNCWHSDSENWHIDYTDIDEAISGNGYVGQVTRQQVLDHLNADPCHNGNPNPYLTVLHRYRGSPH